MARNKGQFQFAANFEVRTAEALDPRTCIEDTHEQLINPETWPYKKDGDVYTFYVHKNMVVSTNDGLYKLIDPSKIIESDYSGWERIDGDTITVDASVNASSTNPVQNKVVKAYVDGLHSAIPTSEITALFA